MGEIVKVDLKQHSDNQAFPVEGTKSTSVFIESSSFQCLCCKVFPETKFKVNDIKLILSGCWQVT
jgi:hypothetical protein